jgi:hypothetical protein
MRSLILDNLYTPSFRYTLRAEIFLQYFEQIGILCELCNRGRSINIPFFYYNRNNFL